MPRKRIQNRLSAKMMVAAAVNSQSTSSFVAASPYVSAIVLTMSPHARYIAIPMPTTPRPIKLIFSLCCTSPFPLWTTESVVHSPVAPDSDTLWILCIIKYSSRLGPVKQVGAGNCNQLFVSLQASENWARTLHFDRLPSRLLVLMAFNSEKLYHLSWVILFERGGFRLW